MSSRSRAPAAVLNAVAESGAVWNVPQPLERARLLERAAWRIGWSLIALSFIGLAGIDIFGVHTDSAHIMVVVPIATLLLFAFISHQLRQVRLARWLIIGGLILLGLSLELLILLSALASKNINIIDLRLGKLNNVGYSAISTDGDSRIIRDLLTKLGDQYYEANLIEFHSM